jgi:hypothetical protein
MNPNPHNPAHPQPAPGLPGSTGIGVQEPGMGVQETEQAISETLGRPSFWVFTLAVGLIAQTVLSFLLPVLGWAADARVLPKGRNRFGVTFAQSAGITDKFIDDGSRASVVAPYNLELNQETVSRLYPQFSNLVNMLNASGLRYDSSASSNPDHGIVPAGSSELPLLGDALALGFLGVQGEGRRNQYNFTYFHGVSEKLSLGLSVPLIKMRVDIDYSLSGARTASDIMMGYASQNPGSLTQDLFGLLQQLQAPTDMVISELGKRGYDLSSFNESGIGDIVLGARYNYFNETTQAGEFINSFQGGVTLPTGKVFSPGIATAVDFGQGVWDANLTHILNFNPDPKWSFSHLIAYTHRFPGYTPKRVRKNPSDVLPDAASEEMALTYLGDKFWTGLTAGYNLSRVVSLETGYEWYWKGKNRFEGGFTDRDYGYLSDNTNLYTETLSIGASISTIPLFLEYKFPLPTTASLTFNIPIAGRNAVIAPYGALECSLFF